MRSKYFQLSLFFFIVCISAYGEKVPYYLPTVFKLTNGGPIEGYKIELRADGFWHSTGKNGKVRGKKLVTPSEREWVHFWNVLNEGKIWKWKGTYRVKDGVVVNDGPVWSVHIVLDNKHIVEAKGRDVYPSAKNPLKSEDDIGESSSFENLEKALRQLFAIENLYAL